MKRDAPRQLLRIGGAKNRVGSGQTGVAGTDLRIVTYGRSRWLKVVLSIDGGMKSAAVKEKPAAAPAFNNPRLVFEGLCLKNPDFQISAVPPARNYTRPL